MILQGENILKCGTGSFFHASHKRNHPPAGLATFNALFNFIGFTTVVALASTNELFNQKNHSGELFSSTHANARCVPRIQNSKPVAIRGPISWRETAKLCPPLVFEEGVDNMISKRLSDNLSLIFNSYGATVSTEPQPPSPGPRNRVSSGYKLDQ